MASILPADPTLDEIRAALAPLIAETAAFDGFSDTALADAAQRAGVDPDVARLAFSGGARDMVDAWFASIDTAMADRWPKPNLSACEKSWLRPVSARVARWKNGSPPGASASMG